MKNKNLYLLYTLFLYFNVRMNDQIIK